MIIRGNREMEMRNNNLPIRKGHIFYHDFKKAYEGSSEVEGWHPAVVVSNNTNNRHSEMVIVAPVTSQVDKKKLPTHVLVKKGLVTGLPKDSTIQCEQLRTIPKGCLKEYLGSIDTETMIMVNDALSVQLATGDSTYRKALKETASKIAEGIRFYEKMIIEYRDNLEQMIIDQTIMKIRIEINKLESFCEENRLFFSDFYKKNTSNNLSSRAIDNLKVGASI